MVTYCDPRTSALRKARAWFDMTGPYTVERLADLLGFTLDYFGVQRGEHRIELLRIACRAEAIAWPDKPLSAATLRRLGVGAAVQVA